VSNQFLGMPAHFASSAGAVLQHSISMGSGESVPLLMLPVWSSPIVVVLLLRPLLFPLSAAKAKVDPAISATATVVALITVFMWVSSLLLIHKVPTITSS
jgi:hypothetical protein